MRRDSLLSGCLAVFLGVAGCGGPDVGPRSHLSADEAAQARAACQFTAGTLPGLSLAKDAPLAGEIPIDNVVILIMENRAFDHLLGALPEAGQPDVEVAPANVTNPDATGKPIPRSHLAPYCFADTDHSWDGAHTEWDNGKNDGFVIANDPNGERAMGFYTADDLPYFYALANAFSIGDHYFSSVLGPTYPNRDFAYAATSFGHTSNILFTDVRPTILLALDQAGIPWIDYYTNAPGPGVFVGSLASDFGNLNPITQFFTDAQAGKLPPVSFVDPDLEDKSGSARTDFHPPGDIEEGQMFISTVVAALTASPQWAHSALFITFDENGGIYDHVPPPPACAPDDSAPDIGAGDLPGDFARYGFRVPLIVVSPYAKAHHVSHAIYDHTSILRFVEARFKLGALTKRDANADPLFDLFDFSHAQLATPPALPAASINQQKLADCLAQFPMETGDGGMPDLASPDMGTADLAPLDGGTTD